MIYHFSICQLLIGGTGLHQYDFKTDEMKTVLAKFSVESIGIISPLLMVVSRGKVLYVVDRQTYTCPQKIFFPHEILEIIVVDPFTVLVKSGNYRLIRWSKIHFPTWPKIQVLQVHDKSQNYSQHIISPYKILDQCALLLSKPAKNLTSFKLDSQNQQIKYFLISEPKLFSDTSSERSFFLEYYYQTSDDSFANIHIPDYINHPVKPSLPCIVYKQIWNAKKSCWEPADCTQDEIKNRLKDVMF